MSKPVASPSYGQILAQAEAAPKRNIFIINNCVRIDRRWSVGRVASWLSKDLRRQRAHLKKSTIESYLAAARAEFPALREFPDPTLAVRMKIATHGDHSLQGSFIKELDLVIRTQGARAIHAAAHHRMALDEFPRLFDAVCASFAPLSGEELGEGTPLMEANGWMRRLGALNATLTGLINNAYWLKEEENWQAVGRSAGLDQFARLLGQPIGGPAITLPLYKWSDAGNVRHYFDQVSAHAQATGETGAATLDELALQINVAMRACVAFNRQMFGMRPVGTST